LLLDTCVYIDGLQGRTPEAVADLLTIRRANHSTAAIQELLHTVGALDPRHPGTPRAIDKIGVLIKSMAPYRILTPDADVAGRAALLSGVICRLQGYQRDDKRRALQDSVIFLQAQKNGCSVLTANVADFDYLLQLVPSGRVLFYRRS
jgi:predicted nucleic acid-binding protein